MVKDLTANAGDMRHGLGTSLVVQWLRLSVPSAGVAAGFDP